MILYFTYIVLNNNFISQYCVVYIEFISTEKTDCKEHFILKQIFLNDLFFTTRNSQLQKYEDSVTSQWCESNT